MTIISHSYKRGFSLIEIAVVLAIIAAIAGVVLTLSNKQLTQNKYLRTIDKMKTLDDALQRYIILSGELPCPAARNTLLSNAAFGVESEAQCNGAAPVGTTDVAGGEIRIGAVPVRELNLPDEYMFDAWNMRITYVMVKALGADGAITSESIAAPASGGIAIVDRNGNSMIDRRAPLDATQFVAYALIAHGENRNGAVNRIGTTTNNCNTVLGDGDNCDLTDAQFRDMRFNNESATDATYFDDIVIWKPVYLINPELR
jgi:prepilin-type N-terminal cleavage/methylation domain-containing protein